MRKISFLKKIIFIVIALGTITSGVFIIRAAGNKGAAPVAHWKFDEGSGNYAYDSSGNANTGTLTSMDTSAAWVNGEYGTALQFDGDNDYVVSNTSGVSLSALTVGLWVKRNPSATTDQILQWATALSSAYPFIVLRDASGGLTWYVNGNYNLSGGTLGDNTWTYLTLTWSGSVWKAYKDGVYLGSYTGGGTYQSNATMFWLAQGYNGYWNGLIDDVRIYNYARTADQIKNDYNAGKALYVGVRAPADCDVSPADCVNKGLVGYWDMDQMGGTTATDKSGNGNTGTLTNGPVWTTGIQPLSGGRAGGGALDFENSNNNYIAVPDTNNSLDTKDMTVSMWLKRETVTGFQGIVAKNNAIWDDTADYQVLFTGGLTPGSTADGALEFRWENISGNSIAVNTQSVVYNSTTNWYHVVFTRWLNGTGAYSSRLYVNGVQQALSCYQSAGSWVDMGCDGLTGDPVNNNYGLEIGRYGNRTDIDFDGIIDDVRVFNRALSAAEVRYQYNQGDPIAHWKMDEGSGSSAYDSSGNANTGTLTNMATNTTPAWQSGVYGTALQFDGENDYVNVYSAGELVAQNTISFSAWVYPTSFATLPKTLYVQNDVDEGRVTHQIYISTAGLLSYDNWSPTGGELSSNVALSLNTWQHVVVVRNNDTVSFYINGVYNGGGTGEARQSAASIDNTLIGARYYGGVAQHAFQGKLDDVRIYNYARTADQIKNDYNDGKAMYVGVKAPADCDASPADCVNKGLVGYWDMDQMGGTTATDKSGNGNTGTLGGGTAAAVPTWTTGVQPFSGGKVGGGALSFDGSNDYVDVADSASLDVTGAITISAWIKVVDTSDAPQIILRKTFAYQIAINGTEAGGGCPGIVDGAMGFLIGSGSTWSCLATYCTSDTSNVEDGRWHFVTGVYDDSINTSKIYVDGILTVTNSGVTVSLGTNNNIVTVGEVSGGTFPFNGSVDDVRIYNRALSAAEIRYQYNQGKPIAWWKMDEGANTATTCNATISSVYDYSGNGNTGTLSLTPAGNITPADAWIDGKYGCALSFDGTDDYVSVADSASLAPSNFSVSFWAKPDTMGSWPRWLGKDTGGVNKRGFLVLKSTENRVYISMYDVNATEKLSPLTSYTVGEWAFFSFTFDGTYIRAYKNGVETTPATNVGAWVFASSPQPFKIGRSYDSGYWYKGLLDDVRLYNYALTPLQVKTAYNEGSAVRFGPLEGLP